MKRKNKNRLYFIKTNKFRLGSGQSLTLGTPTPTFQLPTRRPMLVPLSHTCQSSWWTVMRPEAELTGIRRASTGVEEADDQTSREKTTADVFWRFRAFWLCRPLSSCFLCAQPAHRKCFLGNTASPVSLRQQRKGNNHRKRKKVRD